MAIKAQCGGCGSTFQAKDSLAGRRVKCPKCKEPLVVPQKGGSGQPATAGAGKSNPQRPNPRPGTSRPAPAAHNPLLDLLDEVQVKSATSGPTCPSCNSEMSTIAVVCVHCGYNVETGEQLSTDSEAVAETGTADVGMTDTDKIMAKAEQEIDDMPISSHNQDFGDGADSFLIAGVAGIVLLVLIGIGLTVIFTMDIVSQSIASWAISFAASVVLWIAMAAWISIVAFMANPVQGLACVLTGGLWCVPFGFMQGKTLLLPTIVLLMSVVVGLASGTLTMMRGISPTTDDSRLTPPPAVYLIAWDEIGYPHKADVQPSVV